MPPGVALAPLDTYRGFAPAALRGLLVLAVLAAFSNSLSVPFLLDDITTIAGNPTIRSLLPIKFVLFPPPEIYSAGRPVLNLSFALNHAIGGTAVGGYHVVNLAIHVAAVLVLFGLLRRAFELPRLRHCFPNNALIAAFLIAGLWAVHPLQVNSVTYISQRAESLMGLFYLLTVYCFIVAVQTNCVAWKIASVIACLFGLATKEVMVTAPVLVFLFDATCVTGSFREAWRERWQYYAGLAAMWLVLGALMVSSDLGRRAVGVEHGMNWFQYARIECLAVVHYLRLALWPDPLIFDHGANLALPSWPTLAIPALVLITILVIAIRQLYRCRVSGFIGFAFFLLLAPTSSVVPVAGQPIAENRMYLPLAFVLAAVVVGVANAVSRRVAVPLVAAMIGLGWLTHDRNRDFRDEVTIWRDTVAKKPTNARSWVYLSQALNAARRPNEGMDALLTALRYHPNSPELENNVAVALFNARRFPESAAHFQTAIRLKPTYAEAYYNFGYVLFETGNIAAALECFTALLKVDPKSVEGHNYAGLCQLYLGDIPAAVASFRRTLELSPQHRAARANLETAIAQKK